MAEKKQKKTGTLRQRVRLGVQLGVTALTNGYVQGYAQGKIYSGAEKAYCVPGLNCYSCPGALGACPIGALQATLGSHQYQFAFYVLGFLVLIGAMIGRGVCGFLCPIGLIQDLFYKIPLPKPLKKCKLLPADRVLRWTKYIMLILFCVWLPLFSVDFVGQGLPWFCKYVCPSGTLMGSIPLLAVNESLRSVAGGLWIWKMLILVLLLVLAVAVYRPFCRYLCPLGAIYGLFHPISWYRFYKDEKACTNCGLCQRACPFDIDVKKKPNSVECIRCGRCLDACPHGCLTTSFEQLKRQAMLKTPKI